MSLWHDFPRDFLRRTMAIVDTFQGPYEVTNLINCCLGLIVIPNDHLIETLPSYTFDDVDTRFAINKRNICYEHTGNYELKNIVRHMRNGLSHGLIQQRPDNGEIAGLRIFDRLNRQSPENFAVELSVDELKKFAFSVAKMFLDGH